MDNKDNDIKLVTQFLRDQVLSDYICNGTMISECILLNTLPVHKIKDFHVVSDFSQYIDIDGILPVFNDNIPKDIKSFINIVLTNELNRQLDMSINGVSTTNFQVDRKDLVEMYRSDEDIKNVFDKINFKTILKHGDYKNEISEMYEENSQITYLTVKHHINLIVIPSKNVPDNHDLENGTKFRLTKNLDIYRYLDRLDSEILTNNNEYLIYSDDGRSYLLAKSVYEYPTIKKFDINEYLLLNIKDM